jgi:hypothetical protein
MDGANQSATQALDVVSGTPPLQAAPPASDWLPAVQQAWSFIPDDPTTASYRLAELRHELERAPTGSVDSGLLAYVCWLHAESERLKRHWLQQCVERERRFRLRENDPAGLSLVPASA